MPVYEVTLEDGSIYEVTTEEPQGRAEQRLQNRKSAIGDLVQNPPEMDKGGYTHPLGTLLRYLQGGAEYMQGVPASVALDLQAGKPQDILPNLGKLAVGQRPAEIGDVYAGAGAPEPLAAGLGLYTDIVLTPGGAKSLVSLGKGAKNLVTKNFTKLAQDIKGGTAVIRDYSANKVNAIRKGFWNTYAPQEWGAYEQAINDLPKAGKQAVKGETIIQNLEKSLFEKRLMSSEGALQKGFTPADNRLIKSYQNISRKWADSPTGELNMADIVDEYKNIRGKYTGKPTPMQKQNIQAANDFFNSVSDQIDNAAFTKAKLRYRTFKENQELINSAVDLHGSEMKTARGERFLTQGALSETTQGRKTAKLITEKTGQKLRGAKGLTKIEQVNPLHWIKR